MTRHAKRLPLYKRITEEIGDRITTLDLAPGMPLPTRSELATHYRTTRATVDRAMQELARDGLITGGSGRRTQVSDTKVQDVKSLAVVWNAPKELLDIGDTYYGPLAEGIHRACAEFRTEVHFRQAQLNACANVLAETQAQGILFLRPGYGDIAGLERLRAEGVPVVAVPGILEAEKVPSVSSDNFQGMNQAVDHLVSLGHSDIGFVCLMGTMPDHFERLQGFLRAMSRHELALNPQRLLITHEMPPSEYNRAVRAWLDPARLPTALITSDFLMALNVLRGLSALGVAVPQDVSLLHFDDPPAASHLTPAMTVIRQSVSELGYIGVQRLIELIHGEEVPLVERVPTELIVRESTAPPR